MAGQLTGYEFDGLLLKGGRKVLVTLQLLRPVAGHLPDVRVGNAFDKQHGSCEVPQIMDAEVCDFGEGTDSPEPLA